MDPTSDQRQLSIPLTGVAGPVELAARWSPAAGSAPTILYLHGFGSSQEGEKAEFFRRRATDEGLGFLSFDFRGHGASGGGMHGLSLERCLADVAAVRRFLRERDQGPLVLLGSSLGGLVGLWTAVEDPAGLAAGVHLAPAVGLRRAIEGWVGAEGLARWREEGEMEVVTDLGRWRIGWQFVDDLERRPTRRLVAAYRLPTLLLQGKHDDSVAWREVVEFAATSRGEEIEVHLFADGDHRLLDHRPRLWALMLEFLAARRPQLLAGGQERSG